MSETTLACDQAIFTSVRTPMGEGYRIIAASGGLRPDEKQTITRSSPSHDSLCGSANAASGASADTVGAAFYAVPRGRMCAALSCLAGAEHTGRGGQRVYTHNVVFDKADFPKCGYNPFVVLRAMVEAGLASPQLKPPPVLPELQLSMGQSAIDAPGATLGPALGRAWACSVLNALLLDKTVIIDLEHDCLRAAEALLMGVPGPMRTEISFSAGIRFSVGRSHRLSLLHDDPSVTKSRIAGRSVEYVDPSAGQEPETPRSDWLTFVERYWQCDDIATLAHRTSRNFANTTATMRERVARIYNHTDAIPETETGELLRIAGDYLDQHGVEEEADLVDELLERAQHVLLDRWIYASWAETSPYWQTVCTLWRQSQNGRRFAHSLIVQAVRVAAADHSAVAAEAVLELVRDVPPSALTNEDTQLVDGVLTRLAQWADNATDTELERLPDLCRQWRDVRPQCPIVDRIHQRCSAPTPR